MVQSASLFSQLLHEVPRHEFARLVNTHQGERHAKGFTCWAQFTAMLFCQLAHTDSLREICNGLACCVGKLVHLGITRGPSKSSLSYANVHRPAAIFEDLFWSMTHRFRARSQLGARTHAFRFKNKLLSLDSTTISLCLSLFPWATFRRAKGGVKAHVLLDHDDYLPAYVLISQATMHDAKVLGLLRLNAGSIVAMDRAYNDYRQFARWTDAGVYFVTRMKDNAVYAVVDERDVPVHRNIHSDAIILLTGPQAQSKCPHLLRRIVVWDAEHEREIVLLTNHLDFGATTEPYRVCRRAFSLRGWSHVTTESVFPRSTRASGAAGPRAWGGAPVRVGRDRVDCGQAGVHGRNAPEVGPAGRAR